MKSLVFMRLIQTFRTKIPWISGVTDLCQRNCTDTGENGTNWPVYFWLSAESYSSLGPGRKKRKEKSLEILAKFACGQVSPFVKGEGVYTILMQG